jgi:hypothetical protein
MSVLLYEREAWALALRGEECSLKIMERWGKYFEPRKRM